MGLEGKIFIAGTGVEEAGVDGESAINDTTPSAALTVSGAAKLVKPLWFRTYFDTEGGAAPDWHFAYLQSDKSVTGKGTTMDAICTLGGASPPTAVATFQNTLSSVTAIVAAEYVVLTERIHVLDNFVSVEGATTSGGVESPGDGLRTMEAHWNHQDYPPFWLTEGAAMLFYAGTGTTDSKYNYSCAWLELDESVYGVD